MPLIIIHTYYIGTGVHYTHVCGCVSLCVRTYIHVCTCYKERLNHLRAFCESLSMHNTYIQCVTLHMHTVCNITHTYSM